LNYLTRALMSREYSVVWVSGDSAMREDFTTYLPYCYTVDETWLIRVDIIVYRYVPLFTLHYTLVSRLADLIFLSSYWFGRFTEIFPIGALVIERNVINNVYIYSGPGNLNRQLEHSRPGEINSLVHVGTYTVVSACAEGGVR